MDDLISRQAAIDTVRELLKKNTTVAIRAMYEIEQLPSAQPEKSTEKHTETHACDLISRQAAIDAVNRAVTQEVARWSLQELPSAQPEQNPDEWCTDCREYDSAKHCCPRLNRVIRTAMADASRWVPCSERLPDEDTDVLITYRDKEGAGDTSYTAIDITSYGDMYFGGNPVHDNITGNRIKHWRQPFAYFTSNYEVIAWMPLPEPYEGGDVK